MKLLPNKKGFTLIELLVVIAILGILAAVVLVAINPAERIRDANDSARKSDIGQISVALETYFTDNTGVYPTASLNELTSGGYLKTVPTDPTGGTYSYAVATDFSEASVYDELEGSGTNWWAYKTVCGRAGDMTEANATSIASTAGCP